MTKFPKKENIVLYCDKVIEWSFFVFCFFLPIPHTATIKSMAKILPIVAFAIKIKNQKNISIKFGPFLTPILLLVFGALMSLVQSHDLSYSLYELRGDLITPILLYFVLINYKDIQKLIKKIYAAFGLSLLYISIVGIFSYLHNVNVQEDGRAMLIFSYPNIAGMYVAHLLVLFIGAYFVLSRKRSTAAVIFLIQAAAFIALFLTGSREGILGAVVSFVLFGLFIDKRLLIGLVLIFAVSTPFLPQATQAKFKSFFAPSTYTDKKQQVYGRIIHWRTALHVISENPAGVGYGWKNSRDAMTRFKNSRKVDIADNILYHAHNTLLEIMVEQGLFGLVIIWAFLFTGVKSFLRTSKMISHSSLSYKILFSLVSSFFAVFIMGSVDYIMRYDQVYLIWLSLGIYTVFVCQDKSLFTQL